LANTTIFSLLLTSTRKLLVSVLWEVLLELGMADWWLVEPANVRLVGFNIPYQSTHKINMGGYTGLLMP